MRAKVRKEAIHYPPLESHLGVKAKAKESTNMKGTVSIKSLMGIPPDADQLSVQARHNTPKTFTDIIRRIVPPRSVTPVTKGIVIVRVQTLGKRDGAQGRADEGLEVF